MRRLALALAVCLFACPAQAQIAADFSALTGGSVRPGYDTGTCNAGRTGAIRYNSSIPAIEFCNGTAWAALYQVQSTPAITAPAGSGYFVLTGTTYTGNFGGLSGADASCLTELKTTHTSWMGYSTANSNGQLVASKVHAFLCDNSTCNNLMPLTSYYFANAGNAAAGGAFFTTNSSGVGPNDSNNWSAANYFSGTYSYWTGNQGNNGTTWSTTASPIQSNSCYTSGSSWSGGSSGLSGQSANTNGIRWNATTSGCTATLNLICFVNP